MIINIYGCMCSGKSYTAKTIASIDKTVEHIDLDSFVKIAREIMPDFKTAYENFILRHFGTAKPELNDLAWGLFSEHHSGYPALLELLEIQRPYILERIHTSSARHVLVESATPLQNVGPIFRIKTCWISNTVPDIDRVMLRGTKLSRESVEHILKYQERAMSSVIPDRVFLAGSDRGIATEKEVSDFWYGTCGNAQT